MTASITTIEDETYTRLKEKWDAGGSVTSGVALVYANVAALKTLMDGTAPFAHADVQLGPSKQVAMGDGPSRFTNYGQLVIAIREGTGGGKVAGKRLVELVFDAFRRYRSPSGVIYRDITPITIGVVGKWNQTDVIVALEADEIK
jgi:hypothetical protein